jgi:hypothetical protein
MLIADRHHASQELQNEAICHEAVYFDETQLNGALDVVFQLCFQIESSTVASKNKKKWLTWTEMCSSIPNSSVSFCQTLGIQTTDNFVTIFVHTTALYRLHLWKQT